MDKLSYTLESYLETVYKFSMCEDGARLTDIAKEMAVTKSTASSAMTTLAEMKLILNEKYQRIKLTESGTHLAESIMRKHEIIQSFLRMTLKIDDVTADSDACAIEHVISNKSVVAMREFVEQYKQ